MSIWEAMKIFIIRRRLLSNMIPKECKHPLEEWMAIKARMTFKKNRDLRERIGKNKLEEVTRKDFDEYQLFCVRRQMKYAEENSPYYRDKFKNAGVKPEDINTWDDLQKIPFTEPSDLAKNSMYFYAVSRTKLAREFTTTGTTGHRKFIGYTTNDLVSKIDIVASALKNIGMTSEDSLHIMFPLVTAWDPSIIMAGACKILGYKSSICSNPDIDKQLTTIKENKTTYIIGVPSFIYRITTLLEKVTPLKNLGIKKVISTSEPLSESLRHLLEETWGCKVLDVWGITEFGLACAVECDSQDGLHTDEANMLFEIIDPETGKHVPDGTFGELVITSLHAECSVLIRYRTRDIAAMIAPPCKCGAHFNRRLAKPKGRMDLQSKIGMGHKIYPILFDEVIYSNKSIVDYRVKITKEGYKDTLTFELETDTQTDVLKEKIIDDVSRIAEIKQGLEEDLINKPRVTFVDLGTMKYTVKAKKILDCRENFE